MTLQTRAWKPLFENDTVSAVVTGTAAYLPFPKTPMGVRAIRVANIGTAVVFFELTETPTATASVATSAPLLPNTVEVFTIANDEIGITFVGSGAGSTIYVTPGEGL